METIIGLFKTECVTTDLFHHGPLKTLTEVEYATAGWVEWWNHRRLHSSLDYRTPAEHEGHHYRSEQHDQTDQPLAAANP